MQVGFAMFVAAALEDVHGFGGVRDFEDAGGSAAAEFLQDPPGLGEYPLMRGHSRPARWLPAMKFTYRSGQRPLAG